MEIITTMPQETMDSGSRLINVISQWSETQGENINIALLDSGIDYNHIDLCDRVKGGINFTSDNRENYMDDSGHGTFCAGIIAANKNGIGMVGIAPQANLYAVKILKDDNTGSILWLKEGLTWCLSNNIHIISMSIGFKEDVPIIRNLVKAANNNNIIMVAASGNDSSRNFVEYPANYEEVIAVSALDPLNQIANFSNTGQMIDFSAPGVRIMSTYLNNQYGIMSGTSFAAPHIVGVVALIQSKALKDTGCTLVLDDLQRELIKHIVDLGPKGKDSLYGYGSIKF